MKMMKSFNPGRVMIGIGLTAATAAIVAMTPAIRNMANNLMFNNKALNDDTIDMNSMH